MSVLKLSDLKALHDRGFALIYLHPTSKRPIENRWTKSPRKTWMELERRFHSSYNVGVRLGEASRLQNGYLCCIDVDIKDPKYKKQALEKLKEIVSDESTYPTVLSGSGNGSKHLYCVSAQPFKMVEIEKHKGQWEICAYSTGRQMVLPPSIHPDTKRGYCWANLFGSLDPFPLFDSGKYVGRKNSGATSDRYESTSDRFQAVEVDLYSSKLDISTIKQITDGQGVSDRSASLMSIALKMCRKGFTDDEILSVLSDENHWISQAAFEHTRSPDRGVAVQWLRRYTLEKARFETHPLRLFEGQPDYTESVQSPEEGGRVVKEIRKESEGVLPDVTAKGLPRASLRNVAHILEHFMGGGLVGFNEFSCRPYFLKDTLYGGKKGAELTDHDDLALKHYIACHYRFEPSKELCFESHTLLAQKYRFHPVKQYLETLEWDGVGRLDSWLREAFRASGPLQYVQAVGRKVLCAAVARIYEPGCKFDYMTVLEGEQGKGKSMSLGMLVGTSWFADSLGDIHNKDVVDQMMGKWLIEVSELDSVRGREAEAVKAFVSRQVDRVRLSYARRSEDYPRQCIFIGSTNDEEYLTDATGNRRYWPVKVGAARREWLKQNRDQLWAEAKFRYELGEKLYLTPELEEVAKGEQEQRFEVDEWESEIRKMVEKDKSASHTSTALWRAINISASSGHPSHRDAIRIGKIMKRLGFKRAMRRIEDIPTKCWVM